MVVRAFMVLVLAFWLVMTVLLVRFTYYPEGTQFAEVPPHVLLRLFFDQGSKNNTMHVYHFERKIGHASLDARPLRFIDGGKDARGHVLRISGMLDKGAVKRFPDTIHWRLETEVRNFESMSRMKGQVRFHESGLTVDFIWSEGEKAPRIQVSQRGEPVTETQMVQTLLNHALGGGATNLPGLTGASPATTGDSQSAVSIKTRRGAMNLGGQKRNGYSMEMGAMDRWKLKAFFTEAGELALATLPDGYRLIEPIIFGLAPEYGEEEEEE